MFIVMGGKKRELKAKLSAFFKELAQKGVTTAGDLKKNQLTVASSARS